MAKKDHDDSMDALDLEAGLEAAFDADESASPADRSVLARLAGHGADPVPVLLREPGSRLDPTPIVKPGERHARRREGRYQIVGEIARGGVGVVFKGHDVDLGRDVAMKVIRKEHEETPELIQRFVEEAQIGGQLQHPGIVPVYEIGLRKNNSPYFTMKLIKGKTLSALLNARETPRTGRRRALTIFESVCQTMAYAHARGVIHRDLKPSNIMVGAFGEVLVVDWGMGKVLRSGGVADERKAKHKAKQTVVTTLRSGGEGSASVVGSVMGTPRYMPPEQARGDIENVDERSDVFGLGAILCEILTGAPPYNGEDHEVFSHAAMAELDDAYERLEKSGAEEELVKIAKRCLMPAAQARFENAGALAKAIGAHISAGEERAEKAKLAAVRAEERAESERAAAKAARKIAFKEKQAAENARRARKLTLALAAVIFVGFLAGGGVLIQKQRAEEQRREEIAQAVNGHLLEAKAHMTEGRLDEAAESVARARERDPDAAAPLAFAQRIEEMRRGEERAADLAEASQAIEEARAELARYAELGSEIRTLSNRLIQEYGAIFRRASFEEDRAAFAAREAKLERIRASRPALLAGAREAIERARRLEEKWDRSGKQSSALLADVFVEQWRLARAVRVDFANPGLNDTFDREGDVASAEAHFAAAMKYDTAKRHEEELLGRGSLTIQVEPDDAEVHLFRYESYETVVTDRPVIPRLVPVPTTGIGRADVAGFEPGRTCFVVTDVEEGSPAAGAGLRPGDLVLSVNGVPCDYGTCVFEVVPGSRADKAGIKPWTRVERANELPAFHFVVAMRVWSNAAKGARSVTAGGIRTVAPAGERLGIKHAPTFALLGAATFERRVQCLVDGAPREVSLPSGQALGARVRVTAYPCVLNDANRVTAGRKITADPGSYLVHVRKPGFEAQRYSLLVPRAGHAEVTLKLNPENTSPAGYVYVPAGRYLFGDHKAFRAQHRDVKATEGFWIKATPVSFADYLAFLNDPATRPLIAADEGKPDEDKLWLVPRWKEPKQEYKDGPPIIVTDKEGKYVPRRAYLETPLYGVRFEAAVEYIKWRNKKAQADGEPWVYDLPYEGQFEKATRGGDGRAWAWGPRFDYNLCVSPHRIKGGRLFWAPPRLEPRDESPYEVADATGGRWEYVRSTSRLAHEIEDSDDGWLCRGGSWSGSGDPYFRLASRGWGEGQPWSGFRLVARRRVTGD